jgi:hypothetical protein
MSARTIFLSRLIGLYCVLAALAMMAQKQATVATVTAMMHDAPLMMFIGIVSVVAGLALVLGHNEWRGGPAAVLVTLLGWITLAKGVATLFLPADAAADLYLGALRYGEYFYAYSAIPLLMGIYLAYAGFKKA